MGDLMIEGRTVTLIGGPASGERRYVASGDQIYIVVGKGHSVYQRDRRQMDIFRHLYDYPVKKEKVDAK